MEHPNPFPISNLFTGQFKGLEAPPGNGPAANRRSRTEQRPNCRRDSEKGCKPSSANAVETDPVAENVRPEKLASVVLDLLIGLEGRFAAPKNWARSKTRGSRSEAEWIAADCQFQLWGRIDRAATSSRGIADAVAKLHVAHANAVRVNPGVEIEAEPCTGVWLLLAKIW